MPLLLLHILCLSLKFRGIIWRVSIKSAPAHSCRVKEMLYFSLRFVGLKMFPIICIMEFLRTIKFCFPRSATTTAPPTTTTKHSTTPCIDGTEEEHDECHNTVCEGGVEKIVIACNKKCGEDVSVLFDNL